MGTQNKSKLKRCLICRQWYRPYVTATCTQKTCSLACRRLQRNRRARKRREQSLQDFRVDERERQRRHRQKLRQQKDLRNTSGTTPAVTRSRAGFNPQPIDLKRLVQEKVDGVLDRSRASLYREFTVLLAVKSSNRGQDGLREV